MLTIVQKTRNLTNRLLIIKRELAIIILLFEEAISLIESYIQASSCEQKFQNFSYLVNFSRRCFKTISTFQELKAEGIMLEGYIDRDLLETIQCRILDEYPEQLCSNVKEHLNTMLQELKQLQSELK